MDLKSEKILIAGAGIRGLGAAALLGNAGIAAAIYDGNEELDKEMCIRDSRVLGYTSSGNVGNWGVEQYYNSQLNGVNGRAYYYFNEELDQEQSVKEPKNGNSVVSTIDTVSYTHLRKSLRRTVGLRVQSFVFLRGESQKDRDILSCWR